MTAKLTVLVVGGGGREHALVWALRRSPRVGTLYIAPGNAGTAALAQNVDFTAEDIPALLHFAQHNHVDLTVVGPEAPLAAGIVDAFQAAGLAIFGPTHAAAQLEASKVFAKAFMQRHNIPTAAYAAFTEYAPAAAYLDTCAHPVVVKADGLAAGKGVIVCDTREAAHGALRQMLLEGAFGAAGAKVVIEQRLTGAELSVLAFSDGSSLAVMPPARDHKRALDGDRGANTGGMGAFAPVPEIAPALLAEIVQTVLQPAVAGMAAEGMPYVGVLYAGLMLTPDGVKTLEFNCRLGDPETQVLLPLLETDLAEIALACVQGRLGALPVRWQVGTCATVVLASPGYPDTYPKGLPIRGVDAVQQAGEALVFHAGTALKDGDTVTSGGRVLAVSAVGADLPDALRKAYAGVSGIHFDGMHYRRDIGRTVSG